MNKKDDLFELANAHIEARLTFEQLKELETRLKSCSEDRRAFSDFMHDHAVLHWNHVSESDGEILDFELPETAAQPKPVSNWQNSALWAAAAAVVFLGVLAFWPKSAPEDPTFAVMEKTQATRWANADLPTARGARLSSGSLKLAEGLATLKFDSGAEVILEAPAEIELIDAMHCRLASGTVVAEIPESAIGFRIETPSARVVDYGTRFAVNVNSASGATRTEVFDGLVEVEKPETGEIVQLHAGERNFVSKNALGAATVSPEEGEWSEAASPITRGAGWTLLESSRDGYAATGSSNGHDSDTLLLVKNAAPPTRGPSRKAYLGFDLSGLETAKIERVQLVLQATPTGWGLAANVPDAEFSIYGLLEPETWIGGQMNWKTAPANTGNNGVSLQSDRVRKLGGFQMAQGVQRGEFSIESAELTEFLRENGNSEVTFILVRETEEVHNGGLVHGFASRRHPTLPAPTLALFARP